MRAPSWQQCATSIEELLLGLLASLFSLLGRLLGSTCRRLLGGALRLVQAAQWALGFFVPGSFQLAHTVANRWAARGHAMQARALLPSCPSAQQPCRLALALLAGCGTREHDVFLAWPPLLTRPCCLVPPLSRGPHPPGCGCCWSTRRRWPLRAGRSRCSAGWLGCRRPWQRA